MRLTKSSIDSLQAGEAEYYVWDDRLIGFGVRISSSGRKSYLIKYRIGSGKSARQRKYTIGRQGSPWTPESARKEALRLLTEISQGEDPSGERKEKRQQATFADLADRYLRDHAFPKKKLSSATEDKRMLDRVLLPAFANRAVAEITRSDIERFHTSRHKTPSTANRHLSLLSKMFNLAERWGLREDRTNPCYGIEKYKERPRQRFLSLEEVKRLGSTLDGLESDGENAFGIAIIRLLVFTGARKGEIIALEWSEIDFDNHLINKKDSKTGAKTIFLPPSGESILRDIPKLDEKWVFPAMKGGRHFQGLTKVWLRIRKEAGLPNVRIHDLRHTFASMAAASGASLPMIGKMLGHTQHQTTQRYAHLVDDAVHAAAATAAESLAKQLGGLK
tara:strand:+ start:1418 stop:2587 length:1170 start_codon:yes stop_codon:yes gene_type:complete